MTPNKIAKDADADYDRPHCLFPGAEDVRDSPAQLPGAHQPAQDAQVDEDNPLRVPDHLKAKEDHLDEAVPHPEAVRVDEDHRDGLARAQE